MSHSLPADPPHARSLTDVLPDAAASLRGAAGRLGLGRAASAIVVLIDGLGAQNLRDHAGHARFLAGAMGKKDTIRSVFPSTTASALTSLTTGVNPGEHGVLGYSVRVPGSDLVTNQLTGWETDGIDPRAWQPIETVFESVESAGGRAFVVNKPEYAESGFTRAAFRGAEFVAAAGLAERFAVAAEIARRTPGALVYTYANELDSAGHRFGIASEQWVTALETLDASARELSGSVAGDTGLLITADHGMVDVPRHAHVLLRDGDPRLDGVAAIGGEPRMLHLYATEGRADDVLRTWRDHEGHHAFVLSRDEAIVAGAFGPTVTRAAAPRIGDVLVAPRARIAYYDDRVADRSSQSMVGQHGSWTPDERIVPLVRGGAYAR